MSVLRARIIGAMRLATGTQQLTPQQQHFQETNAVGRWSPDYDSGTHAPAYVHRRYNDGTCDTISLDCSNGTYNEYGGQGARDIAVGRI